MDFFRDLGTRVERRWRAARFDSGAFSAIAAEELERTPAHRHVSYEDVLDWCNRPGVDIPLQFDIQAKFGDPPVTVFEGRGMHIDVNVWSSNTTTVHEHGFEGGFQVLSGSSVHTPYGFVEERRYNQLTFAGTLTARESEILRPGETRAIVRGAEFIHSLFHLDDPSTTVVVRTHAPRRSLQRNFYLPGLAVDGFTFDETARRLEQLATFMGITSNPRLDAWLSRYLDSAGPRELLGMLQAVAHGLRRRRGMDASTLDALLEPVVRHVERLPGSWGLLVSDAFGRRERLIGLATARQTVTNADHRFFLALLLNAQSASAIYRLVHERFPDREPRDLVFDWVAELCGPKSALGLTLNGTMQRIARLTAQGRSVGAIREAINTTRQAPVELVDVERAQAELRASFLGVLLSGVEERPSQEGP